MCGRLIQRPSLGEKREKNSTHILTDTHQLNPRDLQSHYRINTYSIPTAYNLLHTVAFEVNLVTWNRHLGFGLDRPTRKRYYYDSNQSILASSPEGWFYLELLRLNLNAETVYKRNHHAIFQDTYGSIPSAIRSINFETTVDITFGWTRGFQKSTGANASYSPPPKKKFLNC